ncbi:hypothetical protein [Faecalibacter bovis]|nr:hypothetical protein [Faecalibacter bovis]
MGTLYLSKMMLVYRNENGKITKVYTGEIVKEKIINTSVQLKA